LTDEDTVFSWRVDQEIRPGKYALTDYNFRTPSNSLLVEVSSKIRQGGNDHFEVFDFPGEYDTRDEGEAYVGARMEEEELPHATAAGESNCRSFVPGFRFDLSESDRDDQNGTYVLTSVTHTAFEAGSFSETGETSYNNFFSCIPVAVPFRPPRTTPRPLVQGSQTAIVVGPKGDEIFTDKFGRVKVRFHWDRDTKRPPEEKSCWIRVSHPWAGKGWGSVSIPRIGQEVIVDFLEGDPDQPIITGRVYNAEQMPPYGLPAGGVVSGLKSNSTKGGGGYNEMSMDDTKGKEKITIHAQYDMSTTVEHDDTQHIVTGNRKIDIDTGTHTEKIKGNTSITIVTGNHSLDVQTGTHTHHVKGKVIENYDATQDTTVTGNIKTKSKTATITVDAAEEIFLHCGLSTLSMKKDGTIKMSGENIEITGGNTVKSGVGHQNVICNTQKVETSGAAINSSAVGMHEITGALVKIN
jgi:type VI secretion system secreted protein VgrG